MKKIKLLTVELYIIDSKFNENTATNYGGAIYVNSGASVNINNVNFTSNAASKRGGAIYSEGTLDINNAIFNANDITDRTGNSKDDYGGAAIFNLDGTLTVDNSQILNSIKDYVYQKAYNVPGDYLDGAITGSGSNTILNTKFDNNMARFGADICILPLPSGTPSLTVDKCNFTNSRAYSGGIYATAITTISNSRFENMNSAGAGSPGYGAAGGSICAMGSITELTLINSILFKKLKNLALPDVISPITMQLEVVV